MRVNGAMVDWEGRLVTPPAGTILRCNQTAGTETSASIVESEAGRVIKRRICAFRRFALIVGAESACRDRFASLSGWPFASVSMIQDTVSAGRGDDVDIVEMDLLSGGGWPRILCAIVRNSEERRGLVCMSAVLSLPKIFRASI